MAELTFSELSAHILQDLETFLFDFYLVREMDPVSLAVGVTGFTFQLIKGFEELSDFFRSIRDAPEEIKSIQRSLRIVSLILCSIREEIDPADFDSGLESTLGECNKTLRELSNIVNGLASKQNTRNFASRTLSSFKIHEHSEKIDKFRKRLDRAESMLMHARESLVIKLLKKNGSELLTQRNLIASLQESLVQQRERSLEMNAISVWNNNLFTKLDNESLDKGQLLSTFSKSVQDIHLMRHDEIVVDLMKQPTNTFHSVATESYIKHESAAYPVLDLRETTTTTYFQTRHFFGDLLYHSEIDHYSGKYEDVQVKKRQQQGGTRTTIRFVPAWWMTRCGFRNALLLRIANLGQMGWQTSLKTFNIVPDDSLVFEFCKQGNLAAVRTLFMRGNASVNDMNSMEKTPLHIAAKYWHPDLCRFLVDAGADRSLEGIILSPLRYDDSGNIFSNVFSRSNSSRLDDSASALVCSLGTNRPIETFRVLEFAGEEYTSAPFLLIFRACVLDCILSSSSGGNKRNQERISLWIIDKIRHECSEKRMEFDLGWWEGALFAVRSPSSWQRDLFQELLRLSPPEVVQTAACNHVGRNYRSGWLKRDDTIRNYAEYLSLVNAKVGTLHFWNDRSNLTPTLAAISKALAFKDYIEALALLGYDFDEFIKREIQLVGTITGWTTSSLFSLFTIPHQTPTILSPICTEESCEVSELIQGFLWDQWVLETKRNGSPFGSPWISMTKEFVDLKELEESGLDLGRLIKLFDWDSHDYLCFHCREQLGELEIVQKFLEQEYVHEGENLNECSMFLLNIDI